EVTSHKVGMADPIWPTAPWHLLRVSWRDAGLGFLVEHSHRLVGFVVGTCAIVLVIGLWFFEQRRWVRWLGCAALVGISIQGLLGGFRVYLHALLGSDLAMVHGIFGQMVFALLVSLVLCTSRKWTRPTDVASAPPEEMTSLKRWSLLVTSLILLQLQLGALV